MKKLATLAALAALALPVIAAEEVVTSSNVVGYQKLTLSPGLSIVGQQFVKIGGGDASIQDLLPSAGINVWGQDSIRVWNGSAYANYYYYGKEAEGIDDYGNAGWGNLDQEAVDATLSAGQGFWINVSGNTTLTMSGEVSSTSTISLMQGLNLVANPLPVAVDIQDIIPGSGINVWGQDSIRVWNGSSYSNYYYYGKEAEGIDDDGNAGWGNLDQEAVDVSIAAGQGFWINVSANTTLTFPNVLAD